MAAEQQNRVARESASAQADMNQKVSAAQSDFEKSRESYRHDRQTALDDLDAKIAKLEANEKTATGKTKAELDAKLPSIRAQRASFGTDFRSIQTATAATWDDSKTRLDKQWDALKTAVGDAP